jgi:adenosine/AMP kinase
MSTRVGIKVVPGRRARDDAQEVCVAAAPLDNAGPMRRVDMTVAAISLEVVTVRKPEDANIIVGQAHFIKTVDDLHEALFGVSAHLRFGIAFCEASGACLVRVSGNDDELIQAAAANAEAIGAGHCFVVLLRDGFPVNVLNPIKALPEVCVIFCATANPLEVIVAVTERGRGILGVIDGSPPVDVESDADVARRRVLLRDIGYKL